MSEPTNKKLYDKVKNEINIKYPTHSLFRSKNISLLKKF